MIFASRRHLPDASLPKERVTLNSVQDQANIPQLLSEFDLVARMDWSIERIVRLQESFELHCGPLGFAVRDGQNLTLPIEVLQTQCRDFAGSKAIHRQQHQQGVITNINGLHSFGSGE